MEEPRKEIPISPEIPHASPEADFGKEEPKFVVDSKTDYAYSDKVEDSEVAEERARASIQESAGFVAEKTVEVVGMHPEKMGKDVNNKKIPLIGSGAKDYLNQILDSSQKRVQ